MARQPEPQVLIDWRKSNSEPPKVCYNCDHYDIDGKCEKFKAEPPLEFSQTPGACDQWFELIPF